VPLIIYLKEKTMTEQKIKDASEAAIIVKNELKKLNLQRAEFEQQKAQIPKKIISLKNELEQVGNNSKSIEDIEKNSTIIRNKLESIGKEEELFNQKIVFINRAIAQKKEESDQAVKKLTATRAELVKNLTTIIVSDKKLVNSLIKLKSAQYAFAAANGASLVDDYAWIWEVADATSDSDAVDEKMLKTFCI